MHSANHPSALPLRVPRPRCALSGATLALALWAAGCQTSGKASGTAKDLEELLAEGRYARAVELAAQYVEDNPSDSAAEALWRRASGAYWLDQGRTLTFEDRQEEALLAFERALDLLPDSPAAREWLDKGHAELAAIDCRKAFEAEASGELDLARRHYRQALEHVPGDPVPISGLARVDVIDTYFKERSNEYYLAGVTALRELRTAEAIQRFQAALKYMPEEAASLERQQEVNRLLAEERVDIGRELEELGNFRAARAEYRMAKQVLPDHAPALEGFERADREVRVLDLLEQADAKLRAGDFDDCFDLFDQALEETALQRDVVAALRDQASETRFDKIYQRALLMESDFRYEVAIGLYNVLLEEQQGLYLDARTRRDTLATYMADAERLYNEAEATEDAATRLKLLRQVELIWPTYKDLAARLRSLDEAEQESLSGKP
jgi:tetratricopeptide (TPR) repeat protein